MSLPKIHNKKIELEDDSLREGGQSLQGKRLSREDCFSFIEKIDKLGLEHCICGYPASSRYEYENVTHIIEKIIEKEINIMPWVLSRLNKSDTDICLEIAKTKPKRSFGIAYFVSVDEDRMAIEGWDFHDVIEKINFCIKETRKYDIPLSLNLEDITRSSDKHISKIIDVLSRYEFYSLALCDSVGVSLPNQTEKLVRKFRESRPGNEKLIWHGHNDFGLATANSLMAWLSGADIISGTFTGIGERAGNLPLEQIILILSEKYDKVYDLELAIECCHFLMEKFGFKVQKFAPLIGDNCYGTQVGTHASALIKAKRFSGEGGLVYSPFDYSKIGRAIKLMIGPQSGRAMCKDKLIELGFSVENPSVIENLLEFAKKKGKILVDQEIKNWANKRIKKDE